MDLIVHVSLQLNHVLPHLLLKLFSCWGENKIKLGNISENFHCQDKNDFPRITKELILPVEVEKSLLFNKRSENKFSYSS